MLLVIMGHCIGDLNNLGNRFILAIYMPLFFSFRDFVLAIIPIKDFVLKKDVHTYAAANSSRRHKLHFEQGVVNDFLVWFLLVLFYVSIIFNVLQRMGLFDQKIGQFCVLVANIFLVILVDAL